jgi:putative membrane protein
VDAESIQRLERPHRDLMKLYFIRSILSGPAIFFTLPYLFFRYHTLRYRFDAEGIHARWGILFRQEVNLAYARIQDIHLTSGLIQRWLKLADVQVQTASGSATPELVIEGFKEFDEIRDYLYTRMRGYQKGGGVAKAEALAGTDDAAPLVRALRDVRDELRATREAIERITGGGAPASVPSPAPATHDPADGGSASPDSTRV